MYHFSAFYLFPFLLRSIAFLIFLFGFSKDVVAQGDLMIFPKRLEFQNTRDRVKILNLHNISKDTVTYRISYINYSMKEDGSFVKIQEPGDKQRFASPFLRFYPSIITLGPEESQVLKVQLIKTSNLQYGEYRSHLYFRAVPKIEETEKILEQKTDELEVNLVPVYGISIANVIRIGESNVEVSISNLSFEKINDLPILNLSFYRNGDFSCYGDIKVMYKSSQGVEKKVGEIQGFAVYSPGHLRKAKIELNNSEDMDYNKGGELIVRYLFQGRQKNLIAEKVLKL